MLLFTFCFCFFGLGFCQGQTPPTQEPYIYNGQNAGEKEFPYAVRVSSSGNVLCGGTIFKDNAVITARHCVCGDDKRPRNERFYVYYGSVRLNDQIRVDVASVSCNQDADIAVLKLRNNLPFDGKWDKAKLASGFNTSYERKGVIWGWGGTASGGIPTTLQKQTVDIYDDRTCNRKDIICIGNERGGACPGDSGSGLMSDNMLVGVCSFLITTCSTVTRSNPNGYVTVDHFYNWIMSQ